MIKNNKGFMLVEVIVTSTVIVTAMIGLYTGFNKLYKNYKIRNSYYNIDAMYATNETIEYLFEDNMNQFLAATFQENQYKYLIQEQNDGSSKCVNYLENKTYCKRIKDFYKVENMLIVEYDKEILKSLIGEESEEESSSLKINQTFKDYINYLIGYYGNTDSDKAYSYIFLTEIYDGTDYYYANIRL